MANKQGDSPSFHLGAGEGYFQLSLNKPKMILEEKESYALMIVYLSLVFHDQLHR